MFTASPPKQIEFDEMHQLDRKPSFSKLLQNHRVESSEFDRLTPISNERLVGNIVYSNSSELQAVHNDHHHCSSLPIDDELNKIDTNQDTTLVLDSTTCNRNPSFADIIEDATSSLKSTEQIVHIEEIPLNVQPNSEMEAKREWTEKMNLVMAELREKILVGADDNEPSISNAETVADNSEKLENEKDSNVIDGSKLDGDTELMPTSGSESGSNESMHDSDRSSLLTTVSGSTLYASDGSTSLTTVLLWSHASVIEKDVEQNMKIDLLSSELRQKLHQHNEMMNFYADILLENDQQADRLKEQHQRIQKLTIENHFLRIQIKEQCVLHRLVKHLLRKKSWR